MTSHFKLQNKRGIGLISLILFVVGSLLLSGCGTEEPKVYRVGILSGLNFVAGVADGFKAEMTELGYVEGENITYDVQATEFDMAAYRKALDKFVADDVDLIFVFPTEASLEAKAATAGTDIPVVFSYAFVEGVGLIDSVREPGGNITGVRYPGPDIAIKRFEIMQELAPDAKRYWIPYQRGYPIVAPQLEALRPVAEAAGITIIEGPADNAADVEANLQALSEGDDIGMDAILFVAEPLAVTPDAFAVMGKFAAEHKIPIGGVLMMVDGYGSIFGVNVHPVGAGEQAARQADKVLKGTAAGTIPVISAESYIDINYTVAQELGVEIPEGLLSQAAEIIR